MGLENGTVVEQPIKYEENSQELIPFIIALNSFYSLFVFEVYYISLAALVV